MAEVKVIAANLNPNRNKSVKKNKLNVCAYARVSTDSEEQLTSYSSQIKHYSEVIKANPDWNFVGVYADEGISGTQVKNRVEFARMIDDAMKGKIDIIIAKSISRFARNTLDTLKYVRKLREKNIDVYFEKENIHTLNLDSEMFLTLFSAFAQAESESTSQNVKMGLIAKMKQGEPIGNQNCYGYIWNPQTKKHEINEKQAIVVRRIFEMYASGVGGRTIAKRLNADGIPTYLGRKWTQSSINRITQNVTYVGDLLGQKAYTCDPISHKKQLNYGEKEQYYVKDHHDAIITRDIWDKCQEILKKRNGNITTDSKKHSLYSLRYDLSGKMKCGFCNSIYVRRHGTKKKDGTTTIYWNCYQRVEDKTYCNHAHLTRDDVIKSAFVELYNYISKNKSKTKDKLLNAIKKVIREDNYKKKLSIVENDLAGLRDKLSKLVDMKLDGVIDNDVYIDKEREIKNQINNIEENKNELLRQKDLNDSLSNRINAIESIIQDSNELDEFDSETFNNVIEQIIIGEIGEDDTPNPNVFRFVLKNGTDIKLKKCIINKTMSFGSTNRSITINN